MFKKKIVTPAKAKVAKPAKPNIYNEFRKKFFSENHKKSMTEVLLPIAWKVLKLEAELKNVRAKSPSKCRA